MMTYGGTLRPAYMVGGDDEPCKENDANSLVRKPLCDDKEDPISMESIGPNNGYCSGKKCISRNTIKRMWNGRSYKDPFTRYEFLYNDIPSSVFEINIDDLMNEVNNLDNEKIRIILHMHKDAICDGTFPVPIAIPYQPLLSQ